MFAGCKPPSLVRRKLTKAPADSRHNSTPEANPTPKLTLSEASITHRAKLLTFEHHNTMPAASLATMAKNKIAKEIDKLTDIGNTPQHIVKNLLPLIQRAEQLHELEQKSPQIRGMTDQIWEKLIVRDAGKYADRIRGPGVTIRDYFKTYKSLVARKKKDDDAARDMLASRMAQISRQRQENTTILDSDGTLIPEAMAPSAPNATTRLLAQHYAQLSGKLEPVVTKKPQSNKPSTVKKLVSGVVKTHHAMGLNNNKRKREPEVSPERAEILKKVFPPLVKRRRM